MSLQDNIQKVTLDFNNPNLTIIRLHQYDKDSRKLIITFVDHGEIVHIDSSTIEARIKMLKPDGYPILNDADINEDGNVTVNFTEQMLLADGNGQAEIMLMEKSTEKILHSMPVKIVVHKSVYCHCQVTSSYEFDALIHALLKVKEAEKIIEQFPEWEVAENNRKKAEQAREQAEINREKNTATAIDNANAATTKANTATINANNATNKANTAASNANTAADKANKAATDAIKATSNANNAASNANTATNNANNAIADMNKKITEANGVINDAKKAITDINNTEQDIKDAENKRKDAENQRNKTFDDKISEVDKIIEDSSVVLDNADTAVTKANTAVTNANSANETADQTIKKLQDAIDSIKGSTGGQPSISTTQPENQEIGDIWFIETER